MKFKKGDKVRIKSLDWFNDNKKNNSYIICGSKCFMDFMTEYCERETTVLSVFDSYYLLTDVPHEWTDEMLENPERDEYVIQWTCDESGKPMSGIYPEVFNDRDKAYKYALSLIRAKKRFKIRKLK